MTAQARSLLRKVANRSEKAASPAVNGRRLPIIPIIRELQMLKRRVGPLEYRRRLRNDSRQGSFATSEFTLRYTASTMCLALPDTRVGASHKTDRITTIEGKDQSIRKSSPDLKSMVKKLEADDEKTQLRKALFGNLTELSSRDVPTSFLNKIGSSKAKTDDTRSRTILQDCGPGLTLHSDDQEFLWRVRNKSEERRVGEECRL